ARDRSQAAAQSAGSAASGTPPADQSSSRPSACLHGHLRLGHEQENAGPARSTAVRYGVLPLPWHSPQTTAGSSQAPAPDQGPAVPSLRPAVSDDASGASACTRSAPHR